VALLARLEWFPLAIGILPAAVTLTACVITAARAALAWQRRQLAVSPPGAAPVAAPERSPFAGSKPTKPLCLAFWVDQPVETVQSTEMDAPVVWQLCRRSSQGGVLRPRQGVDVASATGKKMWLKLVAGSPFGWQLSAAGRVGWDSADLEESVPGDDPVDRLAVTAAGRPAA